MQFLVWQVNPLTR